MKTLMLIAALAQWDMVPSNCSWDIVPAAVAKATPKPAVKPAATIIDYIPPAKPSSIWTYPGTIRQHMQEGIHRGTLNAQEMAGLTDAELEIMHSLQHEGKPSKPLAVEKLVASVTAPKPAVKRGTLMIGGVLHFQHSDNVYRVTKEPGVCYCGDNCQCGDCPGGNCPTPAQKAPTAPARQVQQFGTCPGGVCPTQRRGLLGR